LITKECSALESWMIGLEEEMFYRVKTTSPLQPTAGSPHAVIQYWQVSEAEQVGTRIRAKLAATGMDWMRVGPDGFWRPDVEAQFMTSDGAVVPMNYTGLVEQTARFKAAAESDQPTAWDEQYMRLSMRATTGLTKSLCRRRPADWYGTDRIRRLPGYLAITYPNCIAHNCLDD
jgi:hypothetical protein